MTFFGASPRRCENISITADQVVEGTEDFTIKLATGDTAVILTNSSADVLIWDTSGILTLPQYHWYRKNGCDLLGQSHEF